MSKTSGSSRVNTERTERNDSAAITAAMPETAPGASSKGSSLEPPLFSPATFYDVVAAARGTGPTEEPIGALRKPALVAFYGFRGGAGRTMALAHVGVGLARRGLGVAVVDLDLEAPGLHSVLGVQPPSSGGAAYLLRDAFLSDEQAKAKLDAAPHVVRVPDLDDLWVAPAGAINQRYLAVLEELNLPNWHLLEGEHPIRVLVGAIARTIPKLDIVLIDCRTGFHPIAATTLFHASDAVVLCTSLSPQVWEGIGVFLDAIAVARSRRKGTPALFVLRSMVPPGTVGDQLANEFATRFRLEHDRRLGSLSEDEAALLEDPERPPWELDIVRYDADVAARGSIDLKRDITFDRYRSLTESLARAVGTDLDSLAEHRSANLDKRKVLAELTIPKSAAFAEELPPDSISELFVKSSRHARIEDPHSTLVIGAKGAGKSLFWRWLIRQPVNARRFIAGHAPRRAAKTEGGPLTLSPDALKELERSAKMVKNETHKAFWIFYALARITSVEPEVSKVADSLTGEQKSTVRDLLSAKDATSLQRRLAEILQLPSAGTLAEQCLAQVDSILEKERCPPITLVYDGLDDGFDVGEEGQARQQRYVVALLQLLSDIRGRYAWVALKVFLREDIWETTSLQNRSHLEAGRVDLKWEPHDLWHVILRLVRTSKTYASAVLIPPADSIATEELERALEPLWGRQISGAQTARTANYVKNRMADGLGRFFPRTLVQMLETAVEHEKGSSDSETGRIIRLRSLQLGIESASVARVADLEAEYTVLAPYLRLFAREQPTGSAVEFRDRLQRKYASSMRAKGGAKKTRGVKAGSLHAGPGGWMKVVEFLKTVGVLGPRGGREDKLQVALLYRPGLKIPSYGG